MRPNNNWSYVFFDARCLCVFALHQLIINISVRKKPVVACLSFIHTLLLLWTVQIFG